MSSLVEISIGKSMLVQIGSFLVFLFLLNMFLFKPITKFLASRRGTIEGNREAAEKSEQEAEELLNSYLESIEGANREASENLAGVRREAELKHREIMEEAREKAGQLISQAVAEIEEHAEVARAELSEETRKNSRAITEKLLGRSLA